MDAMNAHTLTGTAPGGLLWAEEVAAAAGVTKRTIAGYHSASRAKARTPAGVLDAARLDPWDLPLPAGRFSREVPARGWPRKVRSHAWDGQAITGWLPCRRGEGGSTKPGGRDRPGGHRAA